MTAGDADQEDHPVHPPADPPVVPPLSRSAPPPGVRLVGPEGHHPEDVTEAQAATDRVGGRVAPGPEDLEARWQRVRVAFVDDPGAALLEAHAVVGRAVEVVAASGDTERIRQALHAYRALLTHLTGVEGADPS